MSQYCLYQAPMAKQIISFPITLIDGTKSMKREFTSIFQTYFEVFQDFSEQERQQFSWAKGLYNNQQFLEDFGDLTTSLNQLLFNLLQIDYPSYLTIILITDGLEPFDYESLQNQILEVKQKYQVQFITILINEQPEHLKSMGALNMLCKTLNENLKLQYIYILQRSKRKNIFEIQNEFRQVFLQIKKQLAFYVKKIKLNQKVRTSILQQELIDEVNPGCLFLAEKNLEIKTENTIMQSTTSACHILQILQSSFQYKAELTLEELKAKCSEVLRVIHDLLGQADFSNNKSDEYQAILLIIQIIKQIINISCKFKQIDRILYENLFAAVQSGNINQLKEISLINQSESSVQKINNINDKMIIEFDQTIKNTNFQCFPIEFLVELKTIIFKSLKSLEECFMSEVKYIQNQKDHLNNFIILLKNQLEIVFQKISINFKDHKQIQQLFILNNLIKQLIQIKNECMSEQFLQSIGQLLVTLQENKNQKYKEEVFIFYHSLEELNFLKLCNDNVDKDDYQSFFVLLINMNESINLDKQDLQSSYQEGMKEIKNNRRIEIGWKDRKVDGEQIIQEFYLIDQQEQVNYRFTSLFELFEKYKEKFQLKKQMIRLCILTDDEQNYWKLHLQIKILQLSQYNIKLIYIAIGLQFMVYIGQQIDQFTYQFVNAQKPPIFNIPKSLSTQIYRQQGVDKFQIKIFQQIAQKFKQNKL